ncbi:MAG: sulfite exporter TauE/SafE family protein [Methylomonas sp.]|jgi:sulfite exporter TauE/SafE/copper chaperone CopZ|uniref:urease accessory protein UreH domain-containing protein n=1 Tax=Methylomonas sp. TaxID=418 RepID=UPI0025EB3B69|nr:sulfite exporter TauE/SafE family protein [Methylomonas sp.]MCK9606291.1 sulfite exporter TauE/SafE family protein [Methylomonas sp.]
MATKHKHFKVDGMQCTGCEDIIIEAVAELPGVERVSASYIQQIVDVVYDDSLVGWAAIQQAIINKGYIVNPPKARRLGILRTILAFLILLIIVGGVVFWGKSQMPTVMQMIEPQAGYAVLFGIGFLTGFHCIGMCGSFVVGYTDTSRSKFRQVLAHLSYGVGKAISYTSLGAGFGLLGASIAITPQIRGFAALAASVFLVLYGLKMLNVFDFLRRFTLRLPSSLNRQINAGIRKQRNALTTGLWSGLLLGCGPLQAMYIMAAGSGDPLQGGMILLMFSLGTLLPLWGFGLFATLLSAKTMHQLARVSGILVIVMGVMMAQRGWQMLKTGHLMKMPQSTMMH